MDFIERLQKLSKKIDLIKGTIETEEATKNALVMPFLHTVLGYDVFDPNEVIPEYTVDTPTKKGEKIDYALVSNGEVQILIECKKLGEKLTLKHASQLFRYFSVSNARLAILTNGQCYQFYTDLDSPNKMDEKPFLTLDLLDIDEHLVPEIKKITKSSFDIGSIVDAAGELKYLNEIKKILNEQFDSPDEDFAKFFATRVYSGPITAKVREQFLELTKKALKQFLKDSINERLKSALDKDGTYEISKHSSDVASDGSAGGDKEEADSENKIFTTEAEFEGYHIIKAVLRQKLDVKRIAARDTQSYFGVLLDDNNRKPLCRLHFNAKQKYLGIFDKDKKETRIPIDKLDDIFEHSEALLTTAAYYIEESD